MLTEEKASRLAALYACDRVYEVLLARGEPVRVEDLASGIADEITVPPGLLRDWLEEDGRFVRSGRRFDLRIKAEGGSLSVEAFVRRALGEAGRPLSSEEVAFLLAAAKRRRPEQLVDTVSKIMAEREEFFPVSEGKFGLSEWLLEVPSQDEEEVLLVNFFEQYAEMRGLLSSFDPGGLGAGAGPVEVARAILGWRGEPTAFKVVALLAWRALGERFDPVEFHRALLEAEGVVPLSDGTWCLSEWVEEARRWASSKAKEAPGEAVTVTPAMVAEAVAEGKVKPLELSREEKEAVNRLMKQVGVLSVMEAVEGALDIGPSDEDFLPASVAVYELLKSDGRLEPVGRLSFAFKEAIPSEVREVPEFLLPHPPVVPPDMEESPDVILEDEGLEGNLAQIVHDPELEDIGEEDEAPELPDQALPADELRYIVLFHHFVSGVIKVRKFDRRVIPREPAFLRVTLVTPEGNRLAWINNELGLMFLGEDFFRQLGFPPSGGVLRLRPADSPDAFLADMVETHRDALISAERINELAYLRGRAEEGLPTFEIVRSIVERHGKGVRFLTVHAEANVVRRVSKRMVASILSGYHCFYQRRSQPDLWTFDERRLAQGFKSAKKKYLKRG